MKSKFMLRLMTLAVAGAMLLTSCGEPAASDASGSEGTASSSSADSGEKVELTMGSWRTDDVEQMNSLLAAYHELNPNVTIKFQPTNPPDYNATLRLQLDGGTGPDLMYARSYATGEELFDAGYFADCTDIPGLKENFTEANLQPWMTKDGKMFAVPFAAVSHAVYYNKDIFEKEGLSVPETFEDFLALCQTLKDKGYTPLANGLADEWDILEAFFLGMLPNYVGGPSQRALYESGEKKFNDPEVVKAFEDISKVAPFLPEGFEAVTYNDSQVMFNSQSAAMFVDGSWTMGVYKDAGFNWGVFAIPAPKGQKTAICFHPDMAITMNANTKHPEEAKAFLTWLCSEEGVKVASKNLPVGYFPMINFPMELDHPQAKEFLALNDGKETDARFVWPKLMELYTPMNQAVIKVLKGEMTPDAAANDVAAAFDKLPK